MGKYDNILDMNGDNSAALILKHVLPNSAVLEFGPGNGYMTQYLKQDLGCDVDIVEINEDDGKKAALHSVHAFIGPDLGDIENFHWNDDSLYDYIIFSDVLEHLYDPWAVLSASVHNLKSNGSILISVPNISHNSVIIDLINRKFNYRPLGLLDNTHIRFFTRSSLLEMVSNAGLNVANEFNTFCAVQDTEFKNSLNDVPEEIAKFLAEREDAQLYQFVWELKKVI